MRIAWGSCELLRADAYGLHRVIELGCDAFFALGDTPYCNSSYTGFGYSTKLVDVNSPVSDFEAHHDQMNAKPGWKRVRAAMPVFYMADDHEWGGDNWDHTLAQANAGSSPINAATQAEVDEHWRRGNQAVLNVISKYYANPTNTDPEAVAEKPPAADAATPASNYTPRHFRIGYDLNGNRNDTSPFIEFFVIDCISHRSPIADADTASKTMLGSAQKQWLKDRVAASTATFKVIMTPKKTFKNAGTDNGDTWGEYQTEMSEILDYFEANNITGLLWCAGDRHTPSIEVKSKADGDAWDHLCVVACPLSVDINNNAVSQIVDTQSRWINRDEQVFGLLEVTQGYLEASICSSRTGSKLWTGRVYAGSNALSYPETRIAVG